MRWVEGGCVAEDTLTPEQRAERGDYVGCTVGALSVTEYRNGLQAAGFTNIEITPTRVVADRMHSAIIRATRPVYGEDYGEQTGHDHGR